MNGGPETAARPARWPCICLLALALALAWGLAMGCGPGRNSPPPRQRISPQPARTSPAAPRYTANDLADSRGDGFPDAAHLASLADRQAFRTWFTVLAESQYQRPHPLPEISDCAALARFAYREALMRHSDAWRSEYGQLLPVSAPDVAAYHYPGGVLGTNLFRVRPGMFQPDQLKNGTFRQFANARILMKDNTAFVSRNTAAARPGDLLFFFQPGHDEPFHTMIFLGMSHYLRDGVHDYVIYDTGEAGGHAAIKLVPLSVLRRHPDARWRPVAGNPHFLGVYRWRILE